MDELIEKYNTKKKEIKSRLNDFKSLSDNEQFKEFMFCLLTPQSNAQRCWQAVEEISKMSEFSDKRVFDILRTKTRFHVTKTKRILNAQSEWDKIKPFLDNNSGLELRNLVAKNVNGYGLKEASHFLRNIGKSDNKIAILDRHIIRNLFALGLIKEEKIKNSKNYLEIEQAFLNFAQSIGIPSDELDILWWSQENGEIFK